MKTLCFISFNEGREKYNLIRSMLERIGCVDGLSGEGNFLCGLYQWRFDATDPHLEMLRAALAEHRIPWSERVDAVYSEDELRAAPLLNFGIDRKPIASGGPRFGTTYDLSTACPRCGTGAVQTSPLKLALAGLPKQGHLARTCIGQTLVNFQLAEALRSAGVSGLELRQTRFYRNDEPLPWWQLISSYTMPKMSSLTKGIIRDASPGWGCPSCERDMFVGTVKQPAEIGYGRSEVDPQLLPDVVQTWECFGRSVLHDDPERHLIRGFAQPLTLVKQKVYEVFRRLSVRRVRFEPVRIFDA